MKFNILKSATLIVSLSALLFSCKKDDKDPPKPSEQELITTLRVQLSNTSLGFSKTFVYKVENGFGSSSLGNLQIDTLKLKANTTYDVVLTVLNEKENPVEDITAEILEKDDEHLFFVASEPANGAGSVAVTMGNKDRNGAPLNQTFKLSTAELGSGKMTVWLIHEPANKNATSFSGIGGETDLQAIFPVVLE